MSAGRIGVAVIGAGMAGRAHAAGYRSARSVAGPDFPDLRLVAVADMHEPFATATARRFGFERAETDWKAVAEAEDIDAVSVVVGNDLHREVVEGLLAAGKHVLCEKPLAGRIGDARAMVAAAERADTVAAVGFTFRRSPAINAIRSLIVGGALGPVRQFSGRYWCDYGCDPAAPMSWRYRGAQGSGALADVGSHLVDIAEFLCGSVASVGGAAFATLVTERPVPTGVVVGHELGEVSDRREKVENEDVADFVATFGTGAVGTLSVSRVAHGTPNALDFHVSCENGSAGFSLTRPAEFSVFSASGRADPTGTAGFRRVLIGPQHPYIAGGLPMDAPGVGHGQNDFFSYQARAFVQQAARLPCPDPCPSMVEGLHNLEVLRAVADAAEGGRASVRVGSARDTGGGA